MAGNSLQDLTQNDWTLIESKATRMTFAPGQEIIHEAARIEHLYVIRRGSAAVELAGTTSRSVIATLLSGDVCGEMAFLGSGRATAAVVAKEEVEVDAVYVDDMRQIVHAFPGFGMRFYRSLAVILVERLRQTSRELQREIVSRRHD
jgi:CRP-like cAMP-binding protein